MTVSKALIETRIQLHYAIQGIAATGNVLAVPESDGSHLTCYWQPDLQAFVGRRLSGSQPTAVGLAPAPLEALILNEHQQAIATLPLPGKTLDEMLHWHCHELTQRGFDTDALTLLNYPPDFPDHPLAHGASFTGTRPDLRQTLAAFFAHSRLLLEGVVTAQAGASPVHIWPHHFDMATLIPLSGSGENARTIGVGLSPGDNTYGQPNWYVTPWPYPPSDALSPLSVGHWHTEGWTGAILTGDVGDPALETTQRAMRTFLDEAIEACHVALAATRIPRVSP
ncbi:MAG: hypothetical protein ACFBSG_16970 [Leptolyngbyaceae cyanobacterium]